MTVKPPKRVKRPYRKKRLLTQDELWKLIISSFRVEFIHFFLPEWVDQIDSAKPIEFLDKELKRLLPKGKAKNRTVDVLMRIHLKNGEHTTFLLHIEVQGYFDALFPKRVFQYYYRISDYLQEPIETLVIMIDDDPNYYPNEYREVLGQTEVSLKYRLFKLLDNPPPFVGKEDLIFSIVMEVAWYGLKNNMLKSDADLEKLKFRLMRRLIERKVDENKIYVLLDFITIYLPFANKQKEIIFERNIESLINEEDIMDMSTMTIREYLVEKVRLQEKKAASRELKKFAQQQQKKFDLLRQQERQAEEEARRQEVEEARRQAEEARRQEEEARRQEEEARRQEEEARRQEEEARRQEEEARRQAEDKARRKKMVLILFKNDFSIEEIEKELLEPLDFVKEVIEEFLKQTLDAKEK